jgi:hypothetical protein
VLPGGSISGQRQLNPVQLSLTLPSQKSPPSTLGPSTPSTLVSLSPHQRSTRPLPAFISVQPSTLS